MICARYSFAIESYLLYHISWSGSIGSAAGGVAAGGVSVGVSPPSPSVVMSASPMTNVVSGSSYLSTSTSAHSNVLLGILNPTYFALTSGRSLLLPHTFWKKRPQMGNAVRLP